MATLGTRVVGLLMAAGVFASGAANFDPASNAFAASPGQPATSSEAGLPAPETLFQRHVDAIGGMEKIRSHTTRRIVGNVEFPQVGEQVFLEMYQEAPDRLYLRVDSGLGSVTETVYDGEIAWMKVGSEPATRIPQDKAAPIVDTAAFYGEADYAARYSKMETQPQERFGDKLAWPVKVESKTGRSARVLFDPETGLILGTDGEAAPGIMQRVFFQDYKEINGVRAPQTLVQVTGENTAILRYRTFEVNVQPERDYFARPAELSRD